MRTKIILLLIFIIVLNINKWSNSIFIERLLASLLLFTGTIPFLYKLEKKEANLPFFEFISLFYILFYSLPIFFIDLKEEYMSGIYLRTPTLKGLFYANIGYLSLLSGFYSTRNTAIFKMLPKLNVQLKREDRIPLLSIAIFILGVLGEIFSPRAPFVFKALFYFFNFFPRISIYLLYFFFLRKKLNIFYIFFLFLIEIPYIVFKDMETGLLGPIVFDITGLIFAYWFVRKKMPFLYLILFFIIFIPFNYTKYDYRLYAWYGPYARKNIVEKTTINFTLLSDKFKNEKLNTFYNGWEVFVARCNLLHNFTTAIEFTPDVIPYWKGYSLRPLLTAPIPRFVMPWKPQERMGQDYGHRYGLLDPTDFSTSLNLPILDELYINFGIIGIIIGMFLIGIAYRILYRIINYEGMSFYTAIIGTIIFLVLLNIGSNISLLFGNLIEYIVVLYIIFLILQRIER